MATSLEQTNQTREKRFEKLYTESHEGIRKRILFLLRGENIDQVEDLEQTTWLKVWCNLPSDPAQPASFLWVSTIASNVVYDFLRHIYVMCRDQKKVARPPIASLDAERGTYEEIEVSGDFAKRVSDRDEVKRVLAKMPERVSRAFLLRAAGYSFGDVASMTGHSYKGLYDAMHKTRIRLQREREREEVAS